MHYLTVSQAAKRFEQENKVNQKLRESKKKLIAALREMRRKNCQFPKENKNPEIIIRNERKLQVVV
jgi:hypothetical protein